MIEADGLGLERLSLNLITVEQWTLEQAVEACARAGVGWIAPWRHTYAEHGVERAAALIRDAGLRVSSLCRGGFFTVGPLLVAEREADNRKAVEEAAALGTDVLVLVCGPPRDADLRQARREIAEGLGRLVPHADKHGVRLAIEPLHPMMVSERSAIVSLAEALDLAERFDPSSVGVIVDVYHVFWDVAIEAQIHRASGRILGFHVSDWTTPAGDVLASRSMIGAGTIEIAKLRRHVEDAGYRGPIEVEVINELLRNLPGEDVFASVLSSFRDCV